MPTKKKIKKALQDCEAFQRANENKYYFDKYSDSAKQDKNAKCPIGFNYCDSCHWSEGVKWVLDED